MKFPPSGAGQPGDEIWVAPRLTELDTLLDSGHSARSATVNRVEMVAVVTGEPK